MAGGRLIAFAAAMTHHQDMGGLTPGSVPTNATEVFQEGLRIPLLKLRDRGVLNDTLIAMIRQNVRIPDTVMGDIHAQVAACSIGARRLREIADRFGADGLTGLFEELLNRSETMTRQALSRIPEGTYRFVDFLDNDGIELDKPIRIEVAVTIKDASAACRFHRHQPAGPRAAELRAVRFAGGGVLRHPSADGPDHSRPMAAASGRSRCICRRAAWSTRSSRHRSTRAPRRSSALPGSIMSALAQALPDQVPAASAGEMLMVAFGGRDRDGRRPFVIGDLVAGGSGRHVNATAWT